MVVVIKVSFAIIEDEVIENQASHRHFMRNLTMQWLKNKAIEKWRPFKSEGGDSNKVAINIEQMTPIVKANPCLVAVS